MMRSSEIRTHNNFQKYFLLVSAFGLAGVIGSLWLGWTLTLTLLLIGVIITMFSLHIAPRQILSWQRARKLDRYFQADLYQLVNQLARRAGLNYSPDMYLINSQTPNAFALGSKDHPIIGITTGLVSLLNERELKGVLAHEISHIKNNDLLTKGLATSFGNLTNTLSWVGRLLILFIIPMMILGIETISLGVVLLLVFSPTLNALLQMGLSRNMEYLADHDAAVITQDPMGLASALYRIEHLGKPWWARIWQSGITEPANDWLRSHPETQKRINRLQKLAGKPETVPTIYTTPLRNLFSTNGLHLVR